MLYFAITPYPLTKVPQRCCDLQHDAHSRKHGHRLNDQLHMHYKRNSWIVVFNLKTVVSGCLSVGVRLSVCRQWAWLTKYQYQYISVTDNKANHVTTNITHEYQCYVNKQNGTEKHTCISLAISRSSRLRFLRMSLRRLSLCFSSTESRRCCDMRFSRSSDVSCLRCRLRLIRSWRSTESSRLFITCMHAAILSPHDINITR